MQYGERRFIIKNGEECFFPEIASDVTGYLKDCNIYEEAVLLYEYLTKNKLFAKPILEDLIAKGKSLKDANKILLNQSLDNKENR